MRLANFVNVVRIEVVNGKGDFICHSMVYRGYLESIINVFGGKAIFIDNSEGKAYRAIVNFDNMKSQIKSTIRKKGRKDAIKKLITAICRSCREFRDYDLELFEQIRDRVVIQYKTASDNHYFIAHIQSSELRCFIAFLTRSLGLDKAIAYNLYKEGKKSKTVVLTPLLLKTGYVDALQALYNKKIEWNDYFMNIFRWYSDERNAKNVCI